ncbi:MAG: hypothetical protein PF508_09690 [Spirochaeta sp.]|nr:hypothetical protein [Spirochaeta sp.]
MSFRLVFSDQARDDYRHLEQRPELQKRLKAVRKTLALLEGNPRHPSLQTHEYSSLTRAVGIKVFEAYAENRTPAAYRVFWCYGPQPDELTIIAITPHP